MDEDEKLSSPLDVDEDKKLNSPLILDEDEKLSSALIVDEEEKLSSPLVVVDEEEKNHVDPFSIVVTVLFQPLALTLKWKNGDLESG